MKKIVEFCRETFLSALIGIIVGTFYLLVILSKYIGAKDVLISTLLSGLIGIIIGSFAKFVFFLLKKNIIKNIRTAYLVESSLIIILTVVFSYFMGVRELKYLLIMAMIALFFAFLLTYNKCNTFIKTNEKLKEFQEKLKADI